MMMLDSAWIGEIDYRISAGIVHFMLLLMLNTPPRRRLFWLRAMGGLALMCGASWVIRYCADTLFTNVQLQGLGRSLQVMMLFLVFFLSYQQCYRVSTVNAAYTSVLALTIFKIAWNSFKTVSSMGQVQGVDAPWSAYSVVGSLVSYVVYFTICFLCCFVYKKMVAKPAFQSPDYEITPLTMIFVFIQMVLEYLGYVFTASSSALFLYYLCAMLYTILNYATLVIIAMLANARHENRTMHDFISNKKRYYEMSHEGIVSLQTKCHDLKHQIAAIRSETGKASFEKYLGELEDSIDEYSTVVECGNPTVDIVLTEKNILCNAGGVKFSYMIDGKLFSFLTEREIYSLFGNALDNAMEGTARVAEPSNRMISLKANTRGNLVVLQVENTCEGTVELVDGLPKTTKSGGSHGFGVPSIRRLAEKYNGSISLRVEDGIFKLSVLLLPPGKNGCE